MNESTSGYSTSNLTSRFTGSGDDLTLHHKRSNLQLGSRNGINKKPLRRGNSTLCQTKKPNHHFVRSRSNVDLNFDDDKNNTVRVGVRGGGGRSSLSSAGTLMLDNNRMTRNKKFQRQPFKGWPTDERDEDNEETDVLPTPDYDSGEYCVVSAKDVYPSSSSSRCLFCVKVELDVDLFQICL